MPVYTIISLQTILKMTTSHHVDNFARVLGDLYSRLFDHRPSLSGEINYFIKEFEVKRGNQELDRLKKALSDSEAVGEHLQDAGSLQLNYYLPRITEQVNKALECASIIQENEAKPGRNVWLEERRHERVEEWSAFMNQMCVKSAAVDAEVDTELQQVASYYREMENKLHIIPDVPKKT